jgi:protein gp37
MAETKIEWADKVWNPITGCTPVSTGCQNCYARRMANRLRGRYGYPANEPFRVTIHPERLEEPLRWKKPARVFVCSMGDLFHEDVKFDWIEQVSENIRGSQQHTFLLLTKRPQRVLDYWKRRAEVWLGGHMTSKWPENVWLGVTVENQDQADKRIPLLLQTPAAVRFISVEPMLGSISIDQWLKCKGIKICDVRKGGGGPVGRGDQTWCAPPCPPFINWIICGAETGPGARPINLEWARDLRDQCKSAGVPFFFKKASGPTPPDLMIRESPIGK